MGWTLAYCRIQNHDRRRRAKCENTQETDGTRGPLGPVS